MNIYHRNAKSSNITPIGQNKTWSNWHCKFGYVSISGLQKLLAGNLVDGFNIVINSAIENCDACKQAKQEHVSFLQQAEFQSQKPGELTHTNV